MFRWVGGGVLVLAVMLLAGVWYVSRPPGNCRSEAVAGGSTAIGGPFELVNSSGRTVTDKDVITEPSLLYFGYTSCPDICPTDVARNADAVDILKSRGIAVKPVFISIDPERDTPKVVGEYAAAMSPDMVGLTGSPEQVKAASKAYRTYYAKQPGDSDFYLVNHSTFSYLVTPDDGFVDYFKRDVSADDMAGRIGCLLGDA